MTDARIHTVLLHSVVAPELRTMSILQDQYMGRQMLDLLIYAAEDVIMAHRCLVAAYMKKASIKQGKAACMYKLHLPKTSRDVIKSLLGLVYFGHLECNLYQVAQVQLAAKQLGFSEAEEACRRYLEAVREAAEETSSMHPALTIKQEPENMGDYDIAESMTRHDELDNHHNPIENISQSDQNISGILNNSNDLSFPNELKVKPEPLNEVSDANDEVSKDAQSDISSMQRKNMLRINLQNFDQDQSVDYMDRYEAESESKGNVRRSQRKRKPTVYVDNFSDEDTYSGEEEDVDNYIDEEEEEECSDESQCQTVKASTKRKLKSKIHHLKVNSNTSIGNYSDEDEDKEYTVESNYQTVKNNTKKRLKSKIHKLKVSTNTKMRLKSKIIQEKSNTTFSFFRSTRSVPLSSTDIVEDSPRFMNITTRSPKIVNYDERILCVGTNRSVGIGGSDSEDNSLSEKEEKKDRTYVPKLKIIPGNTMPKNCRSKYALPRVVEIPTGRKRKITSQNAQSIGKAREILVLPPKPDLEAQGKNFDSISGTITEIRVYPTKPVVCPKVRRFMYSKQLTQPVQASRSSSVPILQASESPQDSQEKVFYVETGTACEERTTNMIKIPDSNEFIVFPTKPVVRHCVNSGNKPSQAEGMQDNHQSDATQPRPVLLCRNKYQLNEDN
ncbi:hypothetical protein CHS0354_028017 [Potamilus streckersoni]|uniref:BTB domain-containing protein n=1 Tax=Potamilus streckersoni TaxID=2493646 RepID=A0AAE0VEE7_9BIVA|nr:hypothetical protein CHS0354_028017 [Potamilus streckersoni]